MLEDHNKLLYPNCEDGQKKLGTTLELLQWKAENGTSDKGFEKLLKIIKKILPRENVLPSSTYEAKKVVCPLGLEVQKIHACINDCILYREEYENLNACPVCSALRYKIRRDDPGDVECESTPRKRVLRRPEGSISKGYGTEEVIEFCVDFIPDLKPIGVPESRYEGRLRGKGTLGKKATMCMDGHSFTQAHYTVLHNSILVAPYKEEHKDILRSEYPEQREDWIDGKHMTTFGGWLQTRLMNVTDDEQLYLLAKQPSLTISTFQGYEINGNTFYTFAQDKKSTNQNSGVRFDAPDDNGKKVTYYGYIEEIWELDYGPNFKVPLFRCKWFNLKDGVQVDAQYGMTTVDLKNLGYDTEPFVLASEVAQARRRFYFVFFLRQGVVRYMLNLIEQCVHPRVLILPTALVPVAPTSRVVRLRLGRAGVSAASGPAPNLMALTVTAVAASSGHIAVSSGFHAVVGDVVWPFLGGTEALYRTFFFLAPTLRFSLPERSPSCPGDFSGGPLANSGDQPRPSSSAGPQPSLHRTGATGPRLSTVRLPPPCSPPSGGSSSPFALSWSSSSSSSSSMALPAGSWEGSYMRDDDIARLVRLRRIPPEVITRAPGAEVAPDPQPGERVVFRAHFDRGLGLPASPFLRQFLDFFGL
ncbi:hypothetical protein QYE76_058681 [Lolium multiflorum]|uniref:DUF4216 domain-containing protein n=1 Tax=Lolium multiflorum TaxID=4521 RepID=A0AAD8WQ49_LOLMU|nr:hypothetical protein QYE76_058681 [Lolium multiflorum]